MVDKDYTDITIILDKSGSMQNLVSDTIGGFNGFLQQQKELPGKARISLVQFNEYPIFNFTALDLKEAQPLTTSSYMPNGGTALLDAVGRVIDETGRRFRDMVVKP